jgi:hypothetical protein
MYVLVVGQLIQRKKYRNNMTEHGENCTQPRESSLSAGIIVLEIETLKQQSI